MSGRVSFTFAALGAWVALASGPAAQAQVRAGIGPLPSRAGGTLSEDLDNDEFIHHGFQGETSPDDAANPPRDLAPGDPRLAIQSQACAPLRAPEGSCASYREADAYIALGDPVSADETRDFARIHPWHGTPWEDRIIEREVSSLAQLKDALTQLVRQCYVLRHVMISSHGSRGQVAFFRGDTYLYSADVSQILGRAGLACALAPEARVQFDGCELGCRDGDSNGAADLLAVVGKLAENPAYAPVPGAQPFSGTAFLFNTTLGDVRPAIYTYFLRPGWHWNRTIEADDDGAILYEVHGDAVATDVPVSSAHACE